MREDVTNGGRAEGLRALVTGGSTGIGAAIARHLADEGASVVAVSRSGSSPAAGVAGLSCDLGAKDELDSLIDSVVEHLGGLDVLINNAGRADLQRFDDFERHDFDATMGLNVWAPLRLSQLARRHLAASNNASIVMIGSVDARRPSAGAALYGSSKAALAALTVVLAKELASDGVRVVQIDPGLIDTPLASDAVDAVRSTSKQVNLVGRVGHPDEIAGLVSYIVSEHGRFATGLRSPSTEARSQAGCSTLTRACVTNA